MTPTQNAAFYSEKAIDVYGRVMTDEKIAAQGSMLERIMPVGRADKPVNFCQPIGGSEPHVSCLFACLRRRVWASSASFGYHSATVARDLWFFLCGHNLNLVCSDAQELEAAGR